ncbi:hypothetical protein GGX14DRAFT_568521 [Mycena pura]|uniref:Uncharacterized protein n=1 Tax=Mycena pura TaxID=153505 RepID=A0AAD6Y7S3_9AGAR|nr:hypothetical protein GGX14DRAFT_568521 [Mycena pura]
MSSTNNTTSPEIRPEHHLHDASEPLPGARGGAPAADYSAGNMERLSSSVWQDADAGAPTRETTDAQGDSARPAMERTNSASDRLRFVEAHDTTGLAGVDSGAGLGDTAQPAHKATAADKLIGRAQQVAGKVAHKPELQEKGELRQMEGKAAVKESLSG